MKRILRLLSAFPLKCLQIIRILSFLVSMTSCFNFPHCTCTHFSSVTEFVYYRDNIASKQHNVIQFTVKASHINLFITKAFDILIYKVLQIHFFNFFISLYVFNIFILSQNFHLKLNVIIPGKMYTRGISVLVLFSFIVIF